MQHIMKNTFVVIVSMFFAEFLSIAFGLTFLCIKTIRLTWNRRKLSAMLNKKQPIFNASSDNSILPNLKLSLQKIHVSIVEKKF